MDIYISSNHELMPPEMSMSAVISLPWGCTECEWHKQCISRAGTSDPRVCILKQEGAEKNLGAENMYVHWGVLGGASSPPLDTAAYDRSVARW